MLSANLIDKVISYISPEAAARRLRSRVAMASMWELKRKFEGASKTRRTEGWLTPSTGANLAMQGGLVTLRNRARDLDRNNPYAKRANDIIAAATVGTGIIPQARGKQKKQVDLVESKWAQWGETTWIDVKRRQTFYGLQYAVMRGVAVSGEVIVRRVIDRNIKGPIPMQIQVLESDYLDHERNETLKNGNQIIQGVEVNKNGQTVAYWLYPNHPGDGQSAGKSVRVDAEDIIHVFREDRIGQVRGVPFAAPVIIRLRDLDEFEDARLIQQKVSCCYSVYLHDMQFDPDAQNNASLTDKVEPGMIVELPPGKDVKFGTPPGTDGYGEYVGSVLRAISVGYGVTYESLTGDLSNVNFSSGRMGRIDFKANVRAWQEHILVNQFCQRVWDWFIQAVALSEPGAAKISEMITVEWTPPKWEYLDPVKEAQGNAIQVRNGEKTLSQLIKENGRDPRAHIAEISETNKLLDEYGVKLDSDPRVGVTSSEGESADE